MVRYGRTVHSKFFHSGYVFFNLIRTVQQTVLCVDVQMSEIHPLSPSYLVVFDFYLSFF